MMFSHLKLAADLKKDFVLYPMAVWGKLYVYLRDPGMEMFCFGSAKTLNYKTADKLAESQNLPFFFPQCHSR